MRGTAPALGAQRLWHEAQGLWLGAQALWHGAQRLCHEAQRLCHEAQVLWHGAQRLWHEAQVLRLRAQAVCLLLPLSSGPGSAADQPGSQDTEAQASPQEAIAARHDRRAHRASSNGILSM
jgi:hypothetical protein